jgi:ATP-dependent phosphofructokinase / diphosphate-dependent phosphofructokinase
MERCIENLKRNGVEALIALGGDDTQSVSLKLYDRGVKVVAVPKTIDNDLTGTDLCFGFDTAVSIATEAIDRVHTTAEAHNRVIVVEVMGREAGWIAIYSGVAGGADVILIPEQPFDIQEIAETIKNRHDRGRYFSIIVVAEGAKLANRTQDHERRKTDEFGHVRLGGIGNTLAAEIEARTGFETRAVVLGHIQRGGSPTAFDRMLATRYGIGAIDLVHQGKFGRMVALKGNDISSVPIADAVSKTRYVSQEFIDVAESLREQHSEEVSSS